MLTWPGFLFLQEALVWSALMGFLLFSDIPSQSTILGGVVIASATLLLVCTALWTGWRLRAQRRAFSIIVATWAGRVFGVPRSCTSHSSPPVSSHTRTVSVAAWITMAAAAVSPASGRLPVM